jgi:hypothetical protein
MTLLRDYVQTIRVARFLLVQHTKTGKYTKLPQNVHEFYQMVVNVHKRP